eukprot:6178106-Pleurochrysis_carterae.AAC.1
MRTRAASSAHAAHTCARAHTYPPLPIDTLRARPHIDLVTVGSPTLVHDSRAGGSAGSQYHGSPSLFATPDDQSFKVFGISHSVIYRTLSRPHRIRNDLQFSLH